MATPSDRLDEYRAKRRAGATPEPFGGPTGARPRLFVVQKHHATALHYDLRLEWQGVLLSWAVPKGPSLDPEIKRLAMQTEDHPVEYADFEGVIPEGNYGAGQVIVWDQGSWVPLEDVAEGLEKGKLLFELKGQKLRGAWTIFRTKRDGKWTREWLLVKKPDAEAGEPTWSEASIFSGLTVEELRGGHDRATTMRTALDEAGAPERAVDAAKVKVMLAETDDAFSDDKWIYELKYDGFRLLCALDNGDVRLFYRSGREATHLFPEIVRAVRLLPYRSLLIDGEVVALDASGHPEFQRLQKRGQLSRPTDIERAAVETPCVCFAFDLLACEGRDLRGLDVKTRKEFLRRVVPPQSALRYTDHIEGIGKEFFDQVQKLGLEGIVAKRGDSSYQAGRSPAWKKIRVERTGDFVICGWTAPKGGRSGFGALHVAAYDGGELAYAGRVGTGFSDKQLTAIRAQLEPLAVEEAPCTGPVPKTRGNHWVRPAVVCELRFKERTADGLLRHPSFLRLRDDKRPKECIAPDQRTPEPAPAPVAAGPAADTRGPFKPTNLTKVFWPDEGYTKSDLIEYYRAVSPWLLPYLRDRPVVLTRYPDGIAGKSFFQKDAPEWAPDWLRTERIWSEQTERDIDYFLCDDVDSLLFLANLGTIPLHVWSSRVTDLAKPDWCILDLDPKGAPFADVVTVAKAIRKLCDAIEMPSFVKTSGSSGLHILLPLAGQCTYEQSRSLGELIARLIESQLPDIATTARTMSKREGRVYIDFLQNGHGRLLVAPFSVRPLPGATVSAPLRWSEVNGKLTIAQFTMRNLPARMKRLKAGDPLAGVLTEKPDLVAVLARLAEELGSDV